MLSVLLDFFIVDTVEYEIKSNFFIFQINKTITTGKDFQKNLYLTAALGPAAQGSQITQFSALVQKVR